MRQLLAFVALGSCIGIAAQASDPVPPHVAADPPAFCVNRAADFYPYTGQPCKPGYQLGAGNCKTAGGDTVAVTKKECLAMAGTVELPFEGGLMVPQPKPPATTAPTANH